MSLRARLTVSFAAVLAVPLLVAAVVVRDAVSRQNEQAARAGLTSAYSTASAVYQASEQRTGTVVADAARAVAARSDVSKIFADPALAAGVAARLRGGLAVLAIVKPDGGVAGLSVAEPHFLSGAQPPPFGRLITSRPSPWAVLSEVRVSLPCGSGCTRLVGSVVGGEWLDQSFVGKLGPGITLVAAGQPSASTVLADANERVQLTKDGDVFRGHLGSQNVVAARTHLASGVPTLEIIVSVAPPHGRSGLVLVLAVMFLLALAAGASMAYLLASSNTKPLQELSDAARAVAGGDFERRIAVSSHDEVGRLAEAFNAMTDNLKSYVGELEESRDEIRRSVRRLGQTLQSTHDLTKLLSVVLETAMVAVQGREGAVFLTGATRSDLYVKVARGIDPKARIPLGEGIAGTVAKERGAILLPGLDRPPRPHSFEPAADTVIAVPLESQNQVIGVVALYGRNGDQPFGATELEAISSLAQQAAVGIENVLLHQEAQRLSITDGLTGAWNYRYFQMRLAQESERAIRFGRPFSLMVLDIDLFKNVNDTYGHQRGDAILIEVARRVVVLTRLQVDTLARYGGEEFVLILPETPLDGAHVVGEKILEAINSSMFGSDDEEPVRVTVSIGLAAFPQHGTVPRALVRAADQAMYEAKARGRNRLVTAVELDQASLGEDVTAREGAPPIADGTAPEGNA